MTGAYRDEKMEQNKGPLQEQHVLFPVNPSLSPAPQSLFVIMCLYVGLRTPGLLSWRPGPRILVIWNYRQFVSHPSWVLGTEPGSWTGAACALSH